MLLSGALDLNIHFISCIKESGSGHVWKSY